MAYQPAADTATTSDLLGFVPTSFHFQEQPEEFDMEDLLRDYYPGSPYSAEDTGGSANAGIPELLHPHPTGDIGGGSSSTAAGIVNLARPASSSNPGCNTGLPRPDTENPNKVLTVSSILSMLREVRDRWAGLSEEEKREYPVVVDLLANTDPWDSVADHPEGFITKATNTKTRGGYWKERPNFTAIRGGGRTHGDGDQQQQQPPLYVGARKTYQFHRRNGARTKWLMNEYHLLDPHSDLPGQVLDEDGLVFREIFTDEHEACVSQEYQSPPKRWRSSAPNGESEVWQHFTKIYNKAGKLAYAACHDCHRIFAAQPKNGTSSLIRHNEKHLQPKSR